MASQLRDMDVLVTGGAGFIGSHLVDSLIEQNEVTVFDNFSTGVYDNVPPEADVIEADIRDDEALIDAMSGIDLVFHEAALVSVEKSVENPRDSHTTNARPTLTVLEEARNVGARVVVASSAAVYGSPTSVPVSETDPKNPASPYAIDKLYLDYYARVFNELYGVETVVLRYFNVYGPRQRGGPYSGVISVFADQISRGGPITVHGEGTQTRDFVHVSDVVQANLLAARTDAVGEAFNIGTSESISIKQLALLMRSKAESDSDIVHTEARPGDVERSRADIERAREKLSYDPSVALEDGIVDLLI